MSKTTNAREYSRVEVPLVARLYLAEDEVVDVCVIDISMNGVFINAGRHIEPNTACHITVLLGRTSMALPIVADGKVVRSSDGNVAIAFESVKIESEKDLESLILFNSADPLQALKEFSQHQG